MANNYGKPKVTGQAQQKVTQVKPRTVKVKAHTRKVTPRAPAFNPNAQPITPGSGITVGQANRMAGNAVTTRYGPQGQQLNQNYARTVQQGVDQQGYFDAYLKDLAGYRQSTDARAAAANTAVQGQANSLRALDQGTLNQTQAANQADAANRGATVSPQLAQDASNASLVRQALMGSFGAQIAGQGRAAGDRAANLAQVVGPGQKLQAEGQNQRSEKELLSQIASLKGQSGAYKQQFLDSLTQSEAKNVLAASIAQGKDLTTLAKTTETVRHNKAQEKIAANNPSKQKTAQEVAYFNKHGYYPKTGPTVAKALKAPAVKKPTLGPGSLTQSQESHVVQAVKGARSAAQTLMSKPGAKSGEVRQLLAAGKVDGIKYTHDEINAAFDLLPPKYGGLGGLSPANVKALQRMGIHVHGNFPVLKGGIQGAQKGVFGL